MKRTCVPRSAVKLALAVALGSLSAQAGPQGRAPQSLSSEQPAKAAAPGVAFQAVALDAPGIPEDHCPVVPDVADKTERARALLARSRCLFAAGRIRECVPVLEEACTLTDSPRCLFNLAAVHHALLHCELARGYYQEYLDRDPYDDGREDALSALEELNGVCGPRPGTVTDGGGHKEPEEVGTITPPPPPPPPPPPASQGATRRIVAYSLFGAAGATAITAALFGAIGERMERDNKARAAETRVRDAEYQSLDDKGRLYNVLGWSFVAGTAALAGTGVLLLVLDANASSEQSVTVGADGLTSVQYRARF